MIKIWSVQKYLYNGEASAKDSKNEKKFEDLSAHLKQMQQQNEELKELFKNTTSQNASNPPLNPRDKIEMAELKSELRALKAVVVDLKVTSNSSMAPSWSPNTDVKPTIPSWMHAANAANAPARPNVDSFSSRTSKTTDSGKIQ